MRQTQGSSRVVSIGSPKLFLSLLQMLHPHPLLSLRAPGISFPPKETSFFFPFFQKVPNKWLLLVSLSTNLPLFFKANRKTPASSLFKPSPLKEPSFFLKTKKHWSLFFHISLCPKSFLLLYSLKSLLCLHSWTPIHALFFGAHGSKEMVACEFLPLHVPKCPNGHEIC